MKFMLILIIFISLNLQANEPYQFFKEAPVYKASYKTNDYKKLMGKLHELEIDVAGVDYKNSIIDVLLNSEELSLLIEKNLEPEIHWVNGVSLNNFVDEGYKTSKEVEEFLKEMSRSYSDIAELVEIGKSVEGRSIWALKISDDVAVKDLTEPSILFNSMHHAREIMSPEVSIDIIEYLLQGYSTDSKVKAWVDSNEIWVIPMLNVDGNSKVWNGDSMWRKNTRNGYGVDLNRNYPFNWNSCNGSSGFQFSPTYRGPKPASEPETQALMTLVEKIKPVFDISYHSYSELVLYPYGCKNDTSGSNDSMEIIGKELGAVLGYEAGTPWEILYEADGSDIDWMLGEHQVIPYVIELNSRSEGFQPSYSSTRDKTVKLNRKAWQLLLDRLNGPGLRGVLPNFSGQAYVKVFKGSQLIQNYRVNPDGSFHIILSPGDYRVASDRFDSLEVSIGRERQDLAL